MREVGGRELQQVLGRAADGFLGKGLENLGEAVRNNNLLSAEERLDIHCVGRQEKDTGWRRAGEQKRIEECVCKMNVINTRGDEPVWHLAASRNSRRFWSLVVMVLFGANYIKNTKKNKDNKQKLVLK